MSEKDVEKGASDSGSCQGASRSPSHGHDNLQQKETGSGSRPHEKENGLPPATRQASHDLDWDSSDDKDDPRNWSKGRKYYQTCMISGIALTVSIGSSILTPGREEIQQEFGVSYEVSLLPFVLYVLGAAFGPIFASPASETFGRRLVYQISVSVFSLFVLGAGFSQSVAALSVCRFLAGFCGSPGLSIGGASVADLWAPAERSIPMALFLTPAFLGPSVAPVIGSYATLEQGWRWTQWSLLFITAACLAGALGMKETYKSVILKQRAKKRGLSSSEPGRTVTQQAGDFVKTQLKRPVHMLLVEPVVGLLTFYIGINFGILYAFFAAYPYVFPQVYGFGLGATGLTFLGLGVGSICGGLFLVIYARTVAPRLVKQFGPGKVPIEKRLHFAMIGSICLPISLFWFGWSANYGVHWICPVIAEALYAFGNMLVVLSGNLYLVDFYGAKFGASAAVANNFMRYTLGFAFPLFIVQMYKALGIGWATSLLGFLQLALTPIPWTFYVYGPWLRARSRYVEG